MSIEIERKFLLKDPNWRPSGQPDELVQGFYKLGEEARGEITDSPFGVIFILNDNARIPLLPEHADDLKILAAELGGPFPAGWKARVRKRNESYVFDLKGPRSGTTRLEFDENPLPRDIGEVLLQGCGATLLRKQRYHIDVAGKLWSLDVYGPPHEGLVVAEVELSSAHEKLVLPDWAGEEITDRKLFGKSPAAPKP